MPTARAAIGRPILPRVTPRGVSGAAVTDEAPAWVVALAPRVHAARGEGVEIIRAHPNDVIQVAKVADGRGAETVRATVADG